MNCFSYKGYQGSVETSIQDKCLYGKLLNITDLILYEGNTVDELEQNFKASVDDYLEHCKQQNKPPKKPFKGSFNVRIGQELHEKASKRASEIGKSLNEYIKDIVQKDTESHA
ncbi:type II toxin-antitoxin system HicB family antitoxin [Methylomonas sp. UP202]|uniref:type II toxin-antitoxin system HicB family antitoxin n=1 Tax=Methylomonas sp. UP202 TaxID=3040943 RepID=UPI00247AE172|nr:type II toxin-antitoxin system HicB family antitoxin [Methylomonas sp. UP202]WGS85745.1 type II toxin-antitoxin system HicB family antitoxin [Methylomonas sp. UP202]